MPNDCAIGPPSGSYCPANTKNCLIKTYYFPDIALLVLLKIISRVKGKNMLNQNPINTNAIANMIIESETAEIASPIEMAIVAAINV